MTQVLLEKATGTHLSHQFPHFPVSMRVRLIVRCTIWPVPISAVLALREFNMRFIICMQFL